jgi:hypothetical protein
MQIIRIFLIVMALAMGFVYFYNLNRDQVLKETGVTVRGHLENKEHKHKRVNGKSQENYLFTICYASEAKPTSDVFVVNEKVYATYSNGDSIDLIQGKLYGKPMISVKEMETPQSPMLLWFALLPLVSGIALFFVKRNAQIFR